MSQINLADYLVLLKEQVKALDAQAEAHSKAWALLEFALADLDQPKDVLYGLLWSLSDNVSVAKTINDSILDISLNIVAKLIRDLQNDDVPPSGSDTKH